MAPEGAGPPLDPLLVRLDAAYAEIARLQAERQRQAGELGALRDELAAIRASTSWRLTAPLRAVVRRLRGGR